MKSRIFKGKSLFYGWIIVAAAALGAFFSGPGQTYSVSIFINSYINGFGWSRSLVSGYYSIATLIAGFTLPLVGKAVDKFGHRKMFAVIPTLLGLTCLWMSIVSHPIMLIVGFFFLRLLGQGSMSLLPSTLVAQWFSRHRGKALSIMGIGGVASFAFFPPANNWLIQNFGAETGWRVWSLALFLLMLPVGWFLVRDKPEDMGETPDGKTSKETKEKKEKGHPQKDRL
ncbi:MFS transporter [Mesotoga sp. Brook.08.YT.4.2.5.1]|uniref:MFS transporter n=1 Tax=Mesotoga sp. Brook.08.YT.4.2.5.1 TaxID=1421001 RepID=UPI000C999DAB|nr:MFS transporter [Mesotoga sp. Brook.08.YT.4.2.5.1]